MTSEMYLEEENFQKNTSQVDIPGGKTGTETGKDCV